MSKLTSAQRRFLDNATLVAALRLLFEQLATISPLRVLGEIADTTSGGTPSRTSNEYYGGNIAWIKSGELNDGLITDAEETITELGLRNSSAKIYPKGTLVVALYGATVGKTGILAFDAASNQAVCAVTPKNNDVSNNFLFWFLRHKRPDFIKDSFGGAQPNISQTVLKKTVLPIPPLALQNKICDFLEAVEYRQQGKSVALPKLPPPFSAQQHIVARIEELAAKIVEARGYRQAAIKQSNVLFASALESVFEGTNLQSAPRSKLAADGFATVVAGQHIMAEEYNQLDDGVPYLTGPADFGAKIPRVKRWTNSPKTMALPGDVLLTVKGAGVGKLNFAPDFEVTIGRQLMAIRPNSKKLTREFVFYFLNHKFKHFQSIATATTVPGFKKTDVENLQVPALTVNEQNRVVSYLEGVEAKIAALKQLQSQTAAELDAMLPAVLDKAFKGEL